MSHKATNWAIEQRGLKPATKLVLWHLCDRHHPDHGCFPSQETLADDCEMSRSSLNTHLKELEDRGLIRRIQRSDKARQRKKTTLYLFPFSVGFEAPEAGADGVDLPQKPCPDSGHGAVSRKKQKPCPKKGKSRVQNLDINPVREPVKNLRARGQRPFFTDDERFHARRLADFINEGGNPVLGGIKPRIADCLMAEAMIDQATAERLGFAERGQQNGR